MRLKRIDIKGFKSFANDTVIHFNEDVIGVVGPNGSGKSNIVDAIRWVLGEQKSKDLRLEKMSDVLFNGTKKRKPGGVAHVDLTFENTKNLLPTEYQQITISRYLYRSGESEYRLNNVACRLKDIRSLFMDTGIGSNSYAIIALGMVEDILSDKENARRRMFEQAAGISKYKSRKRETLQKLNHTQNDLDRVEDLLYEIEQNLLALEKQAKRTQRYFNLKEKYKTASIQYAILDTKELKATYASLSGKIEQEQDLFRQLEVKLRETEAALEKLKQIHLDKEKSLSNFQKEVNGLISAIREAENDKKILEQKVDFSDQNQTNLNQRIHANAEKASLLEKQVAQEIEVLAQNRTLEEKHRTAFETAKNKLQEIKSGHGSAKQNLEVLIRGHQQVQHEMVQVEKNIAVNDTSLNASKHDLDRLKDQIRSRSSGYQDLESKIKNIQARIKEQAGKVNALEEEEFKRLQDRANLEAEEDKLNAALNEYNRKLDARKHEYNLVKNLVDKLEGFPDSIKFLNKSGQWPRKAPLFSDLIYCPEQYRVVIEHYLEPYLNYYVVDSYADAAAAIDLLSKAQKGRANFFVLEGFSNEKSDSGSLNESIPALDIIEIDTKYSPIAHYLLKHVYLTDKEPSELKAVFADFPEAVFLSQDGKYVKRRQALGGGSVGLFEGKKLGRKKNLKKLAAVIETLTTQIKVLEDSLDEVNDKLGELDATENQEDLDQEKKQLEDFKREQVYLTSRFEHFQDVESSLQEAMGRINDRITILTAEQAKLKKQKSILGDRLDEERSKMDQVDDSYNVIARQLADQNEVVNQKNIELIRIQSQRESAEREKLFNENQIKELKQQVEIDTQRSKQNLEERKNWIEKIEALKVKLEESYVHKNSMEGDLTSLEQAYYQARGEITELENQVRNNHKLQSDQQLLINELKDKFTEVKLKMGNIGERLKIEFDISLEEILSETVPEVEDVEELALTVERMRNRIANYGEINPMAVEAYAEMEQRYQSIGQQRDDILKARDSLMETIEEIELTATQRFMEAFSEVRTHFIEVFRSLFTEDDNCDLVLLDPSDPLNSQIEIIAKPKGKRPKTLSQLSGGEKTLTAIALLFGLYLLKPAPFCIFDEVDAPLDDANIEKFNRIIKQFSRESQFIIVTHNKLTMAAVDVIYGVYMEEQGISNVSPVDFRNYAHASLLEVR